MGKGIATVVSASKKGGFKLSVGSNHIMGLLQAAMGSGDSSNPFQDLGLGEDMIFDLLDMSTFAPVQDRIRDIFEDFEANELASLQKRPDNLKIVETSEGEAAILVYAVDLESDSEFAVAVTGTANGLMINQI